MSQQEQIAFLESELLAARRVCEMAIPRQIQVERENSTLQQHNTQLLQNLSKAEWELKMVKGENARLRKEKREHELRKARNSSQGAGSEKL